MDNQAKNKIGFYCKINNQLITEYNLYVEGVLIDSHYAGDYWEAFAYFDQFNFTLNAFAQKEDFVKEVEVLKFPLEKIERIWLSVSSINKARLKTKFISSILLGFGFGLMLIIGNIFHNVPGYSDDGSFVGISIFLSFVLTIIIFAFQFFFPNEEKIFRIDMKTWDRRIITLFTDVEAENRVRNVISKFFKKPDDGRFIYRDLDLN